MKSRCLRSLLVLTGLALGAMAAADEYPVPPNSERSTESPMAPSEVAATAKLPPGFRLSVVAAEPEVRNPIAMTMDERGRLWVAENHSWAGGGFGGFNDDVRDRILIFEDADGDGTYEKRTVFWDQARKLTSIEVGNGGVWAICLPQLLFIPDQDRDDVPDSEPVVVLDGFVEASSVSHTPANGLKWGPDGWLYGRHGILGTSLIGKPGASDSQRFAINTGVWRYHPTRGVAEPVMHGMTNSWGFDFDKHGEMFVINTVIGHLWQVIPGAHTERMFGLDINPHSYQLIKQVADHVHWDEGERWSDVRKELTDSTSEAGGGHAHIGLMIYQGDNWPAEYRDRVYTLNLHGRRLNADILKRNGAGYVATHGPDFCFMQDPWYRGMELLTGPDGSVLIADWSDTGECHDHDGVHHTSGRIYKLTYGEPKPLAPFDLQKESNEELIKLLGHRNTWWARQARRVLTERTAAQSAEETAAMQAKLKQQLQAEKDAITRIRLLETIATTGGADEAWWIEQLKNDDEYQRCAALKFLVDLTTQTGEVPSATALQALQKVAAEDPSGLVQLHLASAMQRLPVELRWEIAMRLAARDEYAHDGLLPLMIWYGIEPAVPLDLNKAIGLIEKSAMPLLTELVARRMTLEIERDPAAVDQMLQLATEGKCRYPESVIRGMSAGLNGWQKAAAPAHWSAAAKKFGQSSDEEIRTQVQGLSVVFGDGRAMDEIRAIVTDKELPAEARRSALRSLLVSRPLDYVPTLVTLLDDSGMTVDALRGLSQYDDPAIPTKILERSGKFDAAARSEMIQTLASRPSSARVLLDAVEAKRIDASEISAFQARQIASLEDEALTRDLTRLWGDIRVSAAEKRAQIDAYREKLSPAALQQADLSAGRVLFNKTCASCHVLYGQGRLLGPDLTGSNRKNLDYLLENVIDPSASVGADFRTVVIAMEDGRVLNGVVSQMNERTLTLQSAQESLTIDRQEIDEMKTSKVSLMPEGQLQKLSDEETRNLIAYLMSSVQAPLPQE
ncbi:c-type cytochrome [Blastopirellula sp. JC732]|uniref:C-type cytochrome n=1 Tax=Blastopirellula sediminis TaxID=2894196 RepID=A0A9X1MU35_9BACT|nr:PVC-type heme-binding CxxCH protein [Blastopirellula sediminis]MCC9605091.1 c-type cytochrome [Blastopirellula sediminis]MCC9631609.1 c-type cytochrome [Blastopirellula sediminis]